MTRQLVLKQVIALFYLLLWVSPVTAQENFIAQLNQAFRAKAGMPHISKSRPDIDVRSAYLIQKSFVDSRASTDPIAGYKAGLTSQAGQKKFNVKQALSGVLFSSGHIGKPNLVSLKDAGKLMIETEIGFILSSDINSPITDPKTLNTRVESVVSVIELPDLAYQSPKAIKGVDLIAANLAAHQFILGTSKPAQEISDIDKINTQLSLNQKILFEGKATDALGGQWQALTWLINHLLDLGYNLNAGDLLITGSLGKMIPAQAGEYEADYGELGKIRFTITQ